MTSNNVFDKTEIASGYEDWYRSTGEHAARQEKAIIKALLNRFRTAETILEVGCGTGYFTRWFAEQDLRVIGLDISRAMLAEAKSPENSIWLQGDAVRLPFPADSFDLVSMITTLEFLPDPDQALIEAIRIAKKGLILGVLNAQSRLGRRYKLEGGPVWESAHFFTPDQLKRLIRKIAGENHKIFWRTTLWPFWPSAVPLPWGGFIGMAVSLY